MELFSQSWQRLFSSFPPMRSTMSSWLTVIHPDYDCMIMQTTRSDPCVLANHPYSTWLLWWPTLWELINNWIVNGFTILRNGYCRTNYLQVKRRFQRWRMLLCSRDLSPLLSKYMYVEATVKTSWWCHQRAQERTGNVKWNVSRLRAVEWTIYWEM